MKTQTLSMLAALALAASALSAQEVLNGCPMEGNAATAAVRALNLLKNRYAAPGARDFDLTATLEALVAPGDDRARWNQVRAATVVGYVHDVKPGGIESVNCRARDLPNRDTHIELVVDPMNAPGPRRVIAEVTPRWRAIMAAHGVDWSTSALRKAYLGRWVRVTGWRLFDEEHANAAENTAPGRARNGRASAWEVHPITSIAVVPRPR